MEIITSSCHNLCDMHKIKAEINRKTVIMTGYSYNRPESSKKIDGSRCYDGFIKEQRIIPWRKEKSP